VYISICQCQCQFVCICQYASICQCLSVSVSVCQYLSVFVSVYQYLPVSVSVNICLYLSVSVTICQHVPNLYKPNDNNGHPHVNTYLSLYAHLACRSLHRPTDRPIDHLSVRTLSCTDVANHSKTHRFPPTHIYPNAVPTLSAHLQTPTLTDQHYSLTTKLSAAKHAL
jgi:hypothetical protein